MPVTPVELAVKLVIHSGGKLHVPLRKDVPKVNILLVSVPCCL